MFKDRVINQFALYGFLKNLRFFEPFFLLFLRSKGLSFTEIGLLYAFREIAINILEIPSGAIADLYGRKTAMLLSLTSYIVSFLVFGFCDQVYLLFVAIFIFSIGEAFRTGTHKAIIFDYLKFHNVLEQKKKIYGYTRSWSQKGSALSVLLASTIVLTSGSYAFAFWASIIPYLIGLVNIASYPQFLNRKTNGKKSVGAVFTHLAESFKTCFQFKGVRALLVQSMVFQGGYKSIKDYIQPLIKAQALLIPMAFLATEEQKTAVLIGGIYFVLHYISSIASKHAHSFSQLFENDFKASNAIIIGCLAIALVAGFGGEWLLVFPISALVIISILVNVWRPIIVSLFGDLAPENQHATVLSIESQSKTLGAAIVAPVMGVVADQFGAHATLIVMGGLLLTILLFQSKIRSQQIQQ